MEASAPAPLASPLPASQPAPNRVHTDLASSELWQAAEQLRQAAAMALLPPLLHGLMITVADALLIEAERVDPSRLTVGQRSRKLFGEAQH